MTFHPVAKKITGLLSQNHCWYETFEHDPVRTSEEAAKIRHNYSLHQGAKALILRIKKTETERKFIMLVIPGDLRFDSHKVKKIFNVKDIRFATKEEIGKLTDGVQIGGVPPFGNLFDLEVVVDPEIFENEKIIFNAGDQRFSVAMKSQDFKNLVKPQIVKITSEVFP
ncbi:hypothetical protein COS31_01030 [Candidatus Roizmanbacteria bacterium CG02_land_8_20_14_3_00_36_15]|uniref:YbaK/aminoacyl-tRNA synthetase-associated domain-containing protein n=2 Tax=Candidatus Roizmaniibacteriota TaxID=1752723 RepID=A0A2M8KLE6_9BACT|nr:MAG: hypothetical protein COS51_03960 [Candidatus Roizmanbacteria bacterium CG03_land_8_20_14_0_80_36_21]PIV38141.1 MAG: hypothetical protein COS31_01030 [Candidatus Roizmanbacteria bacterium CG02_land_8_20_14_3_00_36_15]PIY70312.1 MAG: hypothetical protein COY89_01835 [Candidatus Roizmanbacteria bacterium CG_4_10_14_0_8_um_filter_36_36]PJA53458.1 MAG: hypothetical protein CO166_01810 [Candidatus Roizmanbacteria bacterium CG_4_9_14_3_um_filter_36_11]PJC81581.1 MAG: hypothetical protein CO007